MTGNVQSTAGHLTEPWLGMVMATTIVAITPRGVKVRRLLESVGSLALVVSVVIAAIAGAIAIFREWRISLYHGMTMEQVADVETSMVLTLVGGILLVLVVMALVIGIKRDSNIPISTQQPITTTWRNVTSYQPPVAELPAGEVINVPHYTVNDKAQPWQAQEKPAPILRSIDDNGEPITVPFDRLSQFIKLTTPTRKEWTGDRDMYGECARFCDLHGLLVKKPNGGWAWDERYPIESRRAWAAQFSSAYTREGTTPPPPAVEDDGEY